jgi:hypothetical protein
VESPICDIYHAADETAHHVIFGCTAAKQFWEAVQIPVDGNWTVNQLKQITPPTHIPTKHFETFLLLCCWHIWKRRNNTVFRNDRTSLQGTLTACKSEAQLWKVRLPKKDKEIVDAWCSILVNAM